VTDRIVLVVARLTHVIGRFVTVTDRLIWVIYRLTLLDWVKHLGQLPVTVKNNALHQEMFYVKLE